MPVLEGFSSRIYMRASLIQHLFNPLTEDILQGTLTHVLSACDRYATLLDEMSGLPGTMTEWLALAKDRVTAHITGTLTVGLRISNRHPSLGHPGEMMGFSEDDLQQHPLIKRISREFVITYMDKAPTNFIICCRKHYFLSICNDLSPLPPAVNTVFEQVARHSDNILADDNRFLQSLGIKTGNDDLPKYALIAKLHKSPVSFRFLTLSHNTSLTPLAKRVTEFFTAFTPSILRLWDDVMKDANQHSAAMLLTPTSTPEAWFITQSSQVISRIQAYNRSCTDQERREAVRQIKTFDFQCLYTKLPHSDLVARLIDLVRSAWLKYHPNMQSFKVFPRKASKKSVFSTGVPTAQCC